jgi:ATPase subunit of ABC transporter with duplicated ATPase domains
MLTVAGLSKAFGGRQLFDDLSLTLQSGEREVILFQQLKPK